MNSAERHANAILRVPSFDRLPVRISSDASPAR